MAPYNSTMVGYFYLDSVVHWLESFLHSRKLDPLTISFRQPLFAHTQYEFHWLMANSNASDWSTILRWWKSNLNRHIILKNSRMMFVMLV